MSKLSRVFAAASLAAAHAASAQTTAAYRARVDSLANVWRPLVAAEATRQTDSVRRAALPSDSVRVGPIVVRSDSHYVDLGRSTAEQLLARVKRSYGDVGLRALDHPFVIRERGEMNGQPVIATGIVDSAGVVQLRSSVVAEEKSLENSWAQKAEELVTDALGREVRDWVGGVIPIDPQDKSAWARARVDLLLAPAEGARRCATTQPATCPEALGLVPVEDPAFKFYSADQRRDLVNDNGRVLRRANQREFDRCVIDKLTAVCDSLIHMVPADAIPAPIPADVRRSLVRYALETGGDGAFDRFSKPGTMARRIEAAAQMPTDSVVARWHARLHDSSTTQTALDATTALASIFWVTVCACLALRSSRWR